MTDPLIHLQDGRLAAGWSLERVRLLVARSLHSEGGLVLQFQGGLESRIAGEAAARRAVSRYRRAKVFPIAVVCESGLRAQIAERLVTIGNEPVFRWLWENLAAALLGREDGANRSNADDSRARARVLDSIAVAVETRGVDRLIVPERPPPTAPLSAPEADDLAAEIERAPRLAFELAQISACLLDPADVSSDTRSRRFPTSGSVATLMDPAALDALCLRRVPGSRGVLSLPKMATTFVQMLNRILRRFADARDHGFHATIVEEILRTLYAANAGRDIWSAVKESSADAFGPDPDRRGGTALVEALSMELGRGAVPPLTLIAHGTGAIHLFEFLDHAAPRLPAELGFGIVLLAPASTFERAARTLQRHAQRIRGFRMFALTDENERLDQLAPGIYPHSLLYLISGVLEDEADKPIVGMQRFFAGSRFANGTLPGVKALRDLVGGPHGQAVWSVAMGRRGRSSTALGHADFGSDSPTLASITHLLQAGF